MILLDGMDEVGIGNKLDARERIEGFIRRYPTNRFIITSRIVGYSDIIFPQGMTATYALCHLNDAQIEMLVNAWFIEYEKQQIAVQESKYCEITGKENAGKFIATIKQEPHLYALAQNPLLLSLLCLAHRQGRTLPKYRVKVYDLIANTLVETWNEVRRLPDQKGDYTQEAPRILNPLGLWMHKDEKYARVGVVPRKDIEDKIALLMQSDGTPEDEAKSQAKRFLDAIKDSKKNTYPSGARTRPMGIYTPYIPGVLRRRLHRLRR